MENTTNKDQNVAPRNSLPPDSDEIGDIGISLALTALAGSIIFGDNTSLFIQIVCFVIYVLGGLSTSFLFYTFLVNKIPETMNAWNSKGGMGPGGISWIFKYYLQLFCKQMFTLRGLSLINIRELGYLTILAMLSLLWITFTLVLLKIIIGTLPHIS